MKKYKRLGLALAVSLASQQVAAQIEEVLVTATKREESLQDVGVAVSAFSGDVLRDEGIVSPRDLFNRVPNVQLQTNSANGQMQLSIRGISFPTFSPIGVQPVVMFQDEIAMTSPQTAGMFIFDMERIEVLRGPQNTLYGRNTTGGAVNFISARPEVGGELNGTADLTVGNFGTVNFNAAVGGPLGDSAAYRVAMQSVNNDGYWSNELDASDRLGEREQNLFRAQFAYEPTDDFAALINIHGGYSDGGSRPVKAHGFAAPGTDVPYSCSDIDLEDFRTSCEDGFGGETLSETDRAFGGIGNDIDNTDAWGGSVRLNWSFDGFDVLSLTGYETNEWDKWEDNTGLRAPILVGFRQKADSDQITQEIRFTSTGSSDLEWIGGFYYHYDDVEFYTSVPITIVPFAPLGFGSNGLFKQETTMYSAFGQIDYSVSDNLKLIAGLRWVSEEKEGIARAQEGDWGDAIVGGALNFERPNDWLFENLAQYNIIEPVETPFSETWDSMWGGKLGLEYTTSSGQLIYAHVTRGEKGGQFADAPDSVVSGSFITPAEPEEVIAYEAGFKSILFDNTLQLNGSVFFNDYTNQQVQISYVTDDGDLVSRVVNAAASEIYGLEAEVVFAPGDGWFLDLGVGLLRSEVTEDTLGATTGGALSIEEGRNLNNAPETTINFGLTKEIQLQGGGTLVGHIDGRYVSDREFNLIDTPETRVFTTDPSYMLFNARVDYRFGSDQQYRASLWAKNLTDELYFNRFEDIGTSNLGYPGDPRTYGVTVGMEF